MSPTFDPDAIENADKNAPEAGYGNNINYGRLYVTSQVQYWKPTGNTDPNTGKSINTAERRDLVPGEVLGQGEVVELTFEVKISEFNPALTFEYSRTIKMQVSSTKTKADWDQIVKPSLVAIFGDKWARPAAEHPYVAVEDVGNINESVSKTTGNVWGVPKFLQSFGQDKNACIAAREKKYGKGSGSPAATPSTSSAPSKEVIEQVKGLVESVRVDAARNMLSARPFAAQPGGDFDADVLLEAFRIAYPAIYEAKK